MSLKLWKQISEIPKLELHITHPLKCGKIFLTIIRVIYGLLDVYHMNVWLFILHSEENNMKHLFQQVVKGKYMPIPNWYSKDLRTIIKAMLTVDSKKRPTWETLLKWRIVYKKKESLLMNIRSEDNNILMKTIKFPKNLINLVK